MANTMHEGGCLCGAMRYRAEAGPTGTATHCFCRMCRKANGGTFVTWVEHAWESFVFTKGEPVRFRSSDLAERAFCGTCGCQLTFQAVGDPGGMPAIIWIALGSLDQPGEIVPTHHIFTDDRPSWLHLQDDLPRWPSQLPWLRTQDELATPTVPEDDLHGDQGSSLKTGDSFEGGCLCGEVRYCATSGEAPTTGHCHCGMCRKATGATLFSWVEIASENFAVTKGNPKHFRSSHLADRMFCGTCGCHITFQFASSPEEEPESYWVTLGSTDRPEVFDPAHQIFMDDRIPWLHLSGDLQSWPGQLSWLRSDEKLSSSNGNQIQSHQELP